MTNFDEISHFPSEIKLENGRLPYWNSGFDFDVCVLNRHVILPIETKICMAGNLADVITYAKFQHYILGGTILHGVEFPISRFIWHWSYNSAAYCAACDT